MFRTETPPEGRLVSVLTSVTSFLMHLKRVACGFVWFALSGLKALLDEECYREMYVDRLVNSVLLVFLTLPPVLWNKGCSSSLKCFDMMTQLKLSCWLIFVFFFNFGFIFLVFMNDGCPRAESRPVAEGWQILSQYHRCAREKQLELSTSVWHALLVTFLIGLISDTYLNWLKKSFLTTSIINVSKSWNFTTRYCCFHIQQKLELGLSLG